MESGEGEVSLPPCKLIAVELGPSTDPNKATLQIVVNKSVETEFKPVTNIESKVDYAKLTPTQYQTNIVLRTKKNLRFLSPRIISPSFYFITRWVKKVFLLLLRSAFALHFHILLSRFSIIHVFSHDQISFYHLVM